MNSHAFAVVAAVGCASEAPAYPVDAVALLAPMKGNLPYVDGPIEVLGTGKPSNLQDGGPRTLAAYRVQLPEHLVPSISLGNATSCRDPDQLLGPGGAMVQDLGLLQRVGDETHFFVPVHDGGRIVYVDTETTTAVTSPGARSRQIVIAVSPDRRVLACGVLTWR